jgi:predicted dinucleotide-binding enzyme
MHITVLGRGPLAEPLATLAEHAGHSVRWVREAPEPAAAGTVDAPDLVILAGSSTAVQTLLESIAPSIPAGVVAVDATIPTQDDRRGGEAEEQRPGAEWISAFLPGARIVRAFASVPAEALATVLNGTMSKQAARLAVPLAGDDRDAKAIVARFMREIGVDPFDLGALASADVLAPGGALWGKALSEVEMLEAVGLLSGDG